MKEWKSFPLLLLFWNAASLTLSICFIRTVIVCGEIKSPQRLIETLVRQLQLWPSSPHWIWTARWWKHAGPAARISQSETATTVTSKKQQQREKVILEILQSFTGNNGSNFNLLLYCVMMPWFPDGIHPIYPAANSWSAIDQALLVFGVRWFCSPASHTYAEQQWALLPISSDAVNICPWPQRKRTELRWWKNGGKKTIKRKKWNE